MNWLRRLVHRKDAERRLDAELQFHLEQQMTDHQRHGMSEADARRQAAVRFGGVEQWKEECREARGTQMVENMWQDLRFAVRMLRRSPGFATVAIVCLALGIGANAAIFSVADALMFRMLPVSHPEQLVLFGSGSSSGVFDNFPSSPPDLFSQPFLTEAQKQKNVFSEMAATESMISEVRARLGGPGSEPERVDIRTVSGNYFITLGVHAVAGRILLPDDDRAPGSGPVAVIRYDYWQRRFHGDSAIVGRRLVLPGTTLTVVGVAAPEFYGSELGAAPDFWVPLSMQPQVQPWLNGPRDTLTQSLMLFGRLRPGVTRGQAESAANAGFQQWLHQVAGNAPSNERVEDMRKAKLRLTDGSRGVSQLRWQFSQALEILMILVGVVLAVACANVANLLLARTNSRQREMSVRVAIGAGTRRLLSQLLAESLLLALLGGIAGLFLANAGIRVLLRMVVVETPTALADVTLNGRMVLYTFGLSLVAAMIFGLAPAWHAIRQSIGAVLKEGSGLTQRTSQSKFASLLVILQVALAFLLVAGAGLFIRTLQNLEQADAGFQKDRVVVFPIDTSAKNVPPPVAASLLHRLEKRVDDLPGVEATSSSFLLFSQGAWTNSVWTQAAHQTEASGTEIRGNRVGERYFEVLGVRLLDGRIFNERDTHTSPPVAIVNQTFAHRFFGDNASVGRRFWLDQDHSFEIVGVVHDAKYNSIREEAKPMFFLSNRQQEDGFGNFIVRSRVASPALANDVRSILHEIEPAFAIGRVQTLAETVDDSLRREQLLARLAGFFGTVALLLACLGLYGVIAYSVSRRGREIAVRMALGAQPQRILQNVIREALMLVGAGLLIGVPAALGSARLVASQFYGVTASDGRLLGGAAVLLALSALMAAFLPARRAAHIDPLITLRAE